VGALSGSDGAKYHCEKIEKYRLVWAGFDEVARSPFSKHTIHVSPQQLQSSAP